MFLVFFVWLPRSNRKEQTRSQSSTPIHMKMFWLSIMSVASLASSASGAVIHLNPIRSIPRIDGEVTTAGRPSLHNGLIVFGQTAPNNFGVTFDTRKGVMKMWGGNDDPTNATRNAAGFFQNEQTGVSSKWAVVGGAPETQSRTVPIKVINLETMTRIDVMPDLVNATGGDQHFFDINANGDLVWVNWLAGTEANLIWANMADPMQQVALATVVGGTSQHPRISKDSGRRITYSPSSTTHRVFDLETMTDFLVYESATGENVLRSRISDDGNWVIANQRPAGETQKRSDIFLFNIKDLGHPATFNLTKDPTVIREDPNIELVDADTGIVVWGQDSTPATEDNYDIYAAVVTGLSSTPVLGAPVLLAAGDGGTGRGNRFPVIDGNLVAWSYHWGDGTSQTVQYMSIGEPVSVEIPPTRITACSKTASAFDVTFETAVGFRYTVEFTDSLAPVVTWTGLPTIVATSSQATVSHQNPGPNASYYRVKVDQP